MHVALRGSSMRTGVCDNTAVQAPKPSAGPHKQRECLPLLLILRNRLK